MVSIKPNHPLDRATGLWRSLLCLLFLVNMEIFSSFFFLWSTRRFLLRCCLCLRLCRCWCKWIFIFRSNGLVGRVIAISWIGLYCSLTEWEIIAVAWLSWVDHCRGRIGRPWIQPKWWKEELIWWQKTKSLM